MLTLPVRPLASTIAALIWSLAAIGAAGTAGAQPWEDLASARGLPTDPAPVGVNALVAAISVADVDGDGHDDLVTSGGNRGPTLWLRDDDRYAAIALGQWLDDPTAVTSGHVVFDMDGDGDLDIFLLRQGRDALLENLGAAAFVERTTSHLPGIDAWSMTAAAADFDGDGDLDLFVSNYIANLSFPAHRCERNHLLANDGAGRFTDVTAEVGLSGGSGCSFVASFVDWDDDGDLDLFVVNDFTQFTGSLALFRNDGPSLDDGRWEFTEITAEVALDQTPIYGMGLGVGDLAGDGALDYLVTNIGEPALLASGPDGRFVDATLAHGGLPIFAREQLQVTWAAAIVDLDGDGWQDVFMAGGHLSAADFIANDQLQPNIWLRGGPEGLREPPRDHVPTVPGNWARDVAFADHDGDGRLDVHIAHLDGRVSLLRSASDSPPQTRLDLRPRYTGAGAAGARVTATCGGETLTRVVASGRMYGAHDDGRVWLAFASPACRVPGAEIVITVRWPSGYAERVLASSQELIDLAEPAWWTLEDGVMRVDLGAGSPTEGVDDETRVEVLGYGVEIGPLVRVQPQGTVWEASYDAPDGEAEGDARVGLRVDGRTWPVQRRVRLPTAPTWRVRTYPQRLVAGRAATTASTYLDATGAPVSFEPPVELEIAGTRVTLDATDAPVYRGVVDVPDETAAAELRLFAGGALVASTTRAIASPVDDLRTDVTFSGLHVSDANVDTMRLWLRALLRDVNGWPVAPPEAAFALRTVAGTIIPTSSFHQSNGATTLRYENALIPDGAVVQLNVFGHAVGPAQTALRLADPHDVGGAVSEARSFCAMSERRLRADSQDRGTAVVFVRDAGGASLPLGGVAPVVEADGVFVGQNVTTTAGSYRLPVAAGDVPGDALFTVRAGPQAPPIPCVVPLVEPPPLPPLSASESELRLDPSDQAPLPLDRPVRFVVVPRTEAGRAVGSGLRMAAGAEGGGAWLEGPTYIGRGRYEVYFRTPTAPGLVTLWVQSEQPPVYLTWTGQIGPPDGGSDPDVAVPDVVEPDVVEPNVVEPDVVEPDVVEPDADDAEVGGPDADDPDTASPADSGAPDAAGAEDGAPLDSAGRDGLGPPDAHGATGTHGGTDALDAAPGADAELGVDTVAGVDGPTDSSRGDGGCTSGDARGAWTFAIALWGLWGWTTRRRRRRAQSSSMTRT